jgi:hypothetical protein
MQTDLLSLPTKELLGKFGAGNAKPGSGSAAALTALIACQMIKTVIDVSKDKPSKKTLQKEFDTYKKRLDEIIPELEHYELLEGIKPILKEFAQTNIIEFLHNFSTPNMTNISDPVYLIYDNLIPKVISHYEVINLLQKQQISLEKLKDENVVLSKKRTAGIAYGPRIDEL